MGRQGLDECLRLDTVLDDLIDVEDAVLVASDGGDVFRTFGNRSNVPEAQLLRNDGRFQPYFLDLLAQFPRQAIGRAFPSDTRKEPSAKRLERFAGNVAAHVVLHVVIDGLAAKAERVQSIPRV